MALTTTQLQDFININIIKNGRNSISGAQMNYIINAVIDWAVETAVNIDVNPSDVVNIDQLTPTTLGVIFDPNTPATEDLLYVSSLDASTWIWNGSAYITYVAPVVNNTEWYLLGTTMDAGGNKVSSIARTGLIRVPDVRVTNATVNTIAYFDTNKAIKTLPVATYPNLTELSYVKGLNSSIQPQLTAKESSLPSMVGNALKVLRVNAAETAKEWTSISSGTPAGITGQIQFNNGGAFGADSGLTFNQTTKALTLTSNYVATGIPTLNIVGSTTSVCPYLQVISEGEISQATLVATRIAGTSAGATNRAFLVLMNVAGAHNVIASNDGLAFSAASHTGYSSTNDQMRLKNGNLSIGTGYTGTARLDVRAQGALSTDIAFRVRNGADTKNIYDIRGTGEFTYLNNSNSNYLLWDANGIFQIGTSYSHGCSVSTTFGVSSISTTSTRMAVSSTTNSLDMFKDGNFQFEEVGGLIQTSGKGAISLKNAAIIPSANTGDRFMFYSADITAGNAAPHFRTENGSIIKLFKGAALTAADATLATAIIRIAELEARLQANGLLT